MLTFGQIISNTLALFGLLLAVVGLYTMKSDIQFIIASLGVGLFLIGALGAAIMVTLSNILKNVERNAATLHTIKHNQK